VIRFTTKPRGRLILDMNCLIEARQFGAHMKMSPICERYIHTHITPHSCRTVGPAMPLSTIL
jgi:hypothetical protein